MPRPVAAMAEDGQECPSPIAWRMPAAAEHMAPRDRSLKRTAREVATTDDTNWRPSEGNVSKQSIQRRRPDGLDSLRDALYRIAASLEDFSNHLQGSLAQAKHRDRASTPPG